MRTCSACGTVLLPEEQMACPHCAARDLDALEAGYEGAPEDDDNNDLCGVDVDGYPCDLAKTGRL